MKAFTHRQNIIDTNEFGAITAKRVIAEYCRDDYILLLADSFQFRFYLFE